MFFWTIFLEEKCNNLNSDMNFETKFSQHVKVYIESVCCHFQLNLTKNIHFIIKICIEIVFLKNSYFG